MKFGIYFFIAVVLQSGICAPTFGSDKSKILLDEPDEAAVSPNFSRQDPIGCSKVILNTPENRKMILERNVYACFDPSCLSNKFAKLYWDVSISSNSGMPKYKILSTSKADAADIFYCEQAIWEALPLDQRITSDIDGTIEFKSENGKEGGHANWAELHPSDRSVLKMHFVPAAVRKRLLTAFDVSAAENVVAMRVSEAKSPKLEAFRQEWVGFLDSHSRIDQTDLDHQKQFLRKKFEGLFLNP